MTPLTSLPDSSRDIALDTSAVINIGRSGAGEKILQAIPNRFIVPDAVEFELRIGGLSGKPDHARLLEFFRSGLADRAELSSGSDALFEQLTLGSGRETLDDGEAATIAIASDTGSYAILDERKANRIASDRYPALVRGTTLDVLGHQATFNAIGRDAVADAVIMALTSARMSVSEDSQLAWVIRLIGKERAVLCPSISKSRLEAIVKSERL